MNRILIVAAMPLVLAACNFKPNGMTGGNGNTAAAVPVTPDAVIVNGVTYVRAGGPVTSAPATAPTPSATIPASSMGVVPAATPAAAPVSTGDEGGQPPSSTTNPDGTAASGH